MTNSILKNFLFAGCILYTSLVINVAYSQSNEDYKQVSALENYIYSLDKDVREKCKTTQTLTENDLADLPIGIAPKGCSGNTTILVVDSAYRAERGGWFFSIYASVVLPGTSTPIAFSAKNIAFNAGGLAASSSTKLVLVSNHPIKVNDNLRIELPADGHNFIEFDCNGFKSINLKGNFIFSDGFLVPDPERALGKTEVTASFEINTADLNNIMIGVNITPFKISGLKDLSFEVKNAVADFSDIINPTGFIFPQDYQQTYGADIQLWRGFYLGEVDVRIGGFSGDEKKPLTLTARNLLIDDLGVSGWFSASNILSLQEGSADGWPLSIDQLSVKLMFNKVAGGSLAGALNIPLLGKDPVAYTAQVEQVDKEMNYLFSIATPSSKEFNAPFLAKIRIAEGSVIALEKKNGKFIPSALLHGDITVENKQAKFSGIKFQSLGLTSQEPYITSGIFSTMSNKDSDDSQNKSVGFPVRIDSINLNVYQGEAAIGFAVALNLMNKESKGFSAATFIQVLAKLEETTTTPEPNSEGVTQLPKKSQHWEFEKIKINDIKLEALTTAIKLKGTLRIFDNNPTYGDGFMGNLDFKIEKIMSNPAKITAYFGSKETYRYWHLDVYVPTTILIPPALTINGMMGGASYHMVRQKPFAPDFNEIDPKKMAANAALSNEVAYIPDEKSGISLLAGITLVVGNENAINADAMFEINFNEHGGMRYAQFNGTAFFFTGIDDRGRTNGGNVPKAPVFASLNMLFDNDNNVFHANLKTYMNVEGLIRGVGPNNLVGEAVIHTDSKDWYVYVGRPSQMFGIDIAHLAVAKTYFMIGTQVENIPPPPPEVREVFNDIDESLMRDGSALARGRGFAAGVHFRVGFKEKFGPFYAAFAIGADVMLRDYGDAYCEGRSGKIGIDGWYASGQAYVFLKGSVGISVKGHKFNILSLGAAALLQAKLPNPAWMKGRLGGRYSVLGGLVKGKFNIKFTVGEKCEIVNPGGELGNIQVIADLKPDLNAEDVNVFTAPQASFNTSLDTDFTMMDAQDNVVTYRIRLAEFAVLKDNTTLQSSIEWNSTKDVAALRTFEILPPQSKLTAKVKLYWEKKLGSGSWESIKVNNEILYEVKETTFTTGTAPDFIPEENVAYSYPVKNQYNFHINEQGTGYVKLRVGQAYLFEQGADGTQWSFHAKFTDSKNGSVEVPLTYDVSKAQATFEVPQSLSKQTVYKFYFVKRPTSTGAIDQNVQRADVQVDTGEDNETTVASNTLQGTITQAVDKDLYASAMRTSQFGTFAEKWMTFSGGQDIFDVAIGNIAVIGKRGNISETFDEVELRGKEGQVKPLVQIIASAETEWMKQYIAPMLYDQYPVDKDVTLSWRDPQVLGVKPLKGVKLTNDQGEYRLTDANVTAGSAPAKSGTVVFGYYLSWYGFKDFNDLRNQAAAKYLNDWSSAPAAAKNLLSAGGFVDLMGGNYPIEITYSLPGTNQVTYKNQVSIKY